MSVLRTVRCTDGPLAGQDITMDAFSKWYYVEGGAYVLVQMWKGMWVPQWFDGLAR